MPIRNEIKVSFWPKDEIPNYDYLFRFISKNIIHQGKLTSVAFKDIEGGLSVDWSAYSTAEETRNRVEEEMGKNPNDYGVIRMKVLDVRNIERQEVEHDPKPNNRAHSNIIGDKEDDEIKLAFKRIYKWIIDPPVELNSDEIKKKD